MDNKESPARLRLKAMTGGVFGYFRPGRVMERSLVMAKRRLLKQLRRSTPIVDRTAIDLHEINLDLTDKIHYDILAGIYNQRFLEENLARVIKSVPRFGGDYIKRADGALYMSKQSGRNRYTHIPFEEK